MTSYEYNLEELETLHGKTVLILGAATGIGREALDLAYESGANVAFGDWNETEGYSVLNKYPDRVLFRKCDVSKWDDVLSLFQDTWKRFGVIHVVLSNAGAIGSDKLLDDEYDESTGILLPPDLKSIEVNLVGHLYVTKCAMHYFKKWPEVRCQIVYTSSAGAFFPAPPIYLYCTAKSGVLGLMRSLRDDVKKKNATVNVVAPWLTVTPMLMPEWLAKWGDLPQNSARGVAVALFLPVVRPEINGKAFFVAGNKIIEFEDTLYQAQPAWMGQELSDSVNAGQKILIGE